MELMVLAVRDVKAGSFFPPMFVRSTALAFRWFESCIQNPDHDFHKFAEDFVLFELGSFMDESGEFNLLEAPRSVIGAMVIKARILQAAMGAEEKVVPIRKER